MTRESRGEGEAFVAARHALTLGAGLVGTGVIALFVRLLIPRFLGPAAFGDYRLAETAAELLFVVLTFGVDMQLRRDAALDGSRARGYLSGLAALRLGLGIVGIGATIVVLRTTGVHPEAALLFAVIAASQVFLVLNNSYAAYEHAAGDVRWIARTNLATKTLWALVIAAVLFLAPGALILATTALTVEALRWMWLTWRAVRRHGLPLRPDLRSAMVVIVASLPFFVNTAAHSLYARIGVAFLGASGGAIEIGVYGVASNFAAIALLGMPVVLWVLVPSTSRAVSRSAQELGALVAGALRISLLIFVPVAVVFHLTSDLWISLLYGDAYTAAAGVLRILAPTFALAYVSTICAIATIQQGRVWTVAAVSIAGVAVAAVLNALLIPWGSATLGAAGAAQGAAWATLGTEGIVTAALLWTSRASLRDPALGRTAGALAAGLAAGTSAAVLIPLDGGASFVVPFISFAATVIVARGVRMEDVEFCRRVVARSDGRRRTVLVEAA